jgi:hypothetical protein
MFSYPLGLAIGNAGTIYVSDIYNAAIRVIASGTVSTLMLEPLQTSTTNPGNNTGAGTNTGTGNNTNTGAGNNATTGSSESGGGSGGGAPTAWYWLALLALIPLRRTAGSKRP